MVQAAPAKDDDGEGGFGTAPLTVAGVARTLGVAASTLRTWDRRYGLGPSVHQAGSHRRYTPKDVARLQVMRRLTLRGVAPVDAARIATEADDGAFAPQPRTSLESEDVVVDPLTLAAALIEPDLRRVDAILARSVRTSGIVKTWTELVQPAQNMLGQRHQAIAVHPGAEPEGLLESAVMQAVREVDRALGTAARSDGVRVLTSRGDRAAAHVVAGGIAERGVSALVVRAEHIPEDDSSLDWLVPARVLVVVEFPPRAEEIVAAAAASGVVEVILLGAGAPELWQPHVHRVRTVAAAVAESVAVVTG